MFLFIEKTLDNIDTSLAKKSNSNSNTVHSDLRGEVPSKTRPPRMTGIISKRLDKVFRNPQFLKKILYFKQVDISFGLRFRKEKRYIFFEISGQSNSEWIGVFLTKQQQTLFSESH